MLQNRAWATSMRCQMNDSNPKQHTTLTRAAVGMSLNAIAMFPKHMTNLSVAYVNMMDVIVRKCYLCCKNV